MRVVVAIGRAAVSLHEHRQEVANNESHAKKKCQNIPYDLLLSTRKDTPDLISRTLIVLSYSP